MGNKGREAWSNGYGRARATDGGGRRVASRAGCGESPVILVTGATGAIGREVVRALPAGLRVRVMTRNPAKAAELFPGAGTRAGVEVVAGDYTDPPSLDRALRGVEKAFLVTTCVDGSDDAAFISAACGVGVERVVKLSAAGVVDAGADDLVTRRQRANEDLLRGCGVGWTLLRPRAFMSNCLSWVDSVRGEGVVRGLYGMSPNACVDPRDVAEVAVRVLTEEEHGGCAYTLTGPEAVTAAGQTRELGRLLGIPLRFEELTPDQARAALGRRYPPPVAEALLASAERQRAGAKAQVEDTVRILTGRPARSFRQWAQDHIGAFAPLPDGAGPCR